MDVFGGAPRFLAYPRPVVVQSGTDAVLKCQIGGDPRPAVIWERNNEKIHPEGKYRVFEDGNVYNLIITSVTLEDSGQYICKAKNCIGETYAAATLKVEGEAQELELREENKPRFLIKPLSTRVGRGEDAMFSCKLWGKPRPEVMWEKDGKKLNEIFESTHFSVSYQDGGWFQLKIFKTRAPDGGVYTCKARNEFGESLAGAVLLVDAGPGHEDEGNRNGYTNTHWKSHQGKQRSGRQVAARHNPLPNTAKVKMFAVTEGKHAKFRCYVTGKPKPEILWRKDGRLILSGRRYLLYEDREGYFTLKVLYCKQQDNGVYVCSASNTAGQTLSAVHLIVKEPLVRFKQPLNDLQVWERDLAVLECEVPEDSVPITWYLEDRRLQPGAKYGMEEWGTKRRLTIRDIGVDDDGIYLCEMADGGRSIAEVAVKGTIVRKLPRKVDVLEGENAAFCAEVEAEEMDIHWYKDGTELRETHQTILKSFGRTHILVFVNTTTLDSGLVTFYVGRSKTSSQLRVKAARHCPPSCPIGVQINTERANAALLSWFPAQDSRKNPPSGYIIERKEVGSQEWLQCLTTDTATAVEILGDSVPCEADYRFRICSVNKYGRSGNVEFPRAVHLVPVARIQAPLQDALVPEGQDACFSIELSASVIGTWFLNGNQLQDDERFSIRRTRTHQSLRIRGVRETDNGAEITFIAYGIRDSAALYIQAPLVKFTPLSEMDRNKFVESGNPIVLYCELSNPEVPVRWYKNGVELHSTEGLHIQAEGTMRRIVIQSADFANSGVYSCDAIDDVIRFNVEVEAPPVRFSVLPDVERNKSTEAGSTMTLQCELSDPLAQVSWYKDGVKLLPEKGLDIKSEGKMRKLIVQSTEFYHSGVYSCKTRGDAVHFNVEVKAPPVRFSAVPKEKLRICNEAGCPIVLQCEISESAAQVHWHKDGDQLLVESGADFLSEGCMRTLSIQSAQLSHAGVYTCTTKDDVIKFHVDIKAAPVRFSAVPDAEKSICTEAGGCFELRCKVSDPKVHVCWFHNDVEIKTETGLDIQSEGDVRKLIVESAEPRHSGLYRCETSDDAVQFIVDIKELPVMFSALPETVKTQLFEADYSTDLHCEISDPSAKEFCYKDGVELISKSPPHIKSECTKKTLAVKTAQTSNSGWYNSVRTDDAIQFNVQDQVPAKTFLAVPEDEKTKSTDETEPVALHCEILDPVPYIYQAKDEKEKVMIQAAAKSEPEVCLDESKETVGKLPETSVFDECLIQKEPDVPIRFEMDQELSHYEVCSGETYDDPCTVDIKELSVAPSVKFSTVPDSQRTKCIESGGPFKLQCEVSDPDAQVWWYKDGNEVLPQDGLIILSNGAIRTLSVETAELYHSGTYSCQTNNDGITFHVEIKAPPPKFIPVSEEETNKSTEVGSSIVLKCELSDANAQVLWCKDGTELSPNSGLDFQRDGNMRKLTVQSAQLSDTGNYTCHVPGDTISFKVHVQPPPVRFSKLPEIARNKFIEAGCPIILQCEISDPTSQVCWLKDGVQLQQQTGLDIQSEGTMRTVIIQSAEPKHSGIYSCEAVDDRIAFKVDVAVPPAMFSAVPETEKNKSFEADCPIILQCEISDPTALVQWYKDGLQLLPQSGINIQTEHTTRTLVIQSAKLSDSGFYSCNTADDISEFFVDVKAPPVTFAYISEDDLHRNIVEQDNLLLYCEVSRSDAVAQWYKDGVEIKSTDNVLVEVENVVRRLIILSAQLSDSGTYTCRAGDNALIFKVNVREPPVMIVYPKEDVHLDRHVPEEIVLSCELSRSNGKVTWYKDGQKLQESENIKLKAEGPYRRLKILHSGIEDSGEYVCDTADDSIFFNLTIKEPPVRIISPSQSQMELCQQTSERMVLSCEISRPNAVVRWYRDGLEVEESNSLILEVDSVYRRLIIPKPTVKDSAEYVCDTADDSVTFIVNIAEPPVRFIRPRKMAYGVEKLVGDTLVLECEVSRANAEVSWKREGEEIDENSNVTIIEDGASRQLIIHSAASEDAGQYVCDARDDVMDFLVKIKEPPLTIMRKADIETKLHFLESDAIVLKCEISRANGVVSWLKDNERIEGKEHFICEEEGTFRSLIVLSADLNDSGEYICHTQDDKVVFSVTVEGMTWLNKKINDDVPFCSFLPKKAPVSIIGNSEKPEHHTLNTGDDLVLQCEVSQANATVQWYHNGVLLHEDSRTHLESKHTMRKLVIPDLQTSDSGEYICDAIDDKMITMVLVQESPFQFIKKDERTNISAYEEDSVTLRATVNRANAPVKWQRGRDPIRGDRFQSTSDGNTHCLTINPLKRGDTGLYTCHVGSDEMNFSVNVRAIKVKFSKPLENVVGLKGCDVALKCELYTPKGDVQWLKDNQEIVPNRHFTIRAEGRVRSLTIHSVSEDDEGEYACESKDERTIATVVVNIPRIVEFIAELHNITVMEGENATFKCVVSPEDAHLAWFRNSQPISSNEKFHISSTGLCHVLQINNCQVSDSCKLTAEAEGVISRAILQVQEAQVFFTKSMEQAVAEEYSDVTLEVEVSHEKGEVQWMRQGVVIHPGPKFTLKQNGRKRSITIHKLVLSDRGTYSCETLHDRTQARLSVEPRKIKIRKGLAEIQTYERETSSFEVELSHSNVEAVWQKNGHALKNNNRLRMTAKGRVHSLTISNLTLDDTGTYTFSVENIRSSAKLIVKEIPVSILKKLEDSRHPEGAGVTLECELSRHNVDVKWTKNGVQLKPGKNLRIYSMGRKCFLQILKCEQGDTGIYTCDAVDAKTSCSVDVYERELEILQGLEDLDIQEDQNAVFVCEVSLDDVPGEWFKNNEKIKPTSTIKIRQEGTKHFLLICNVKGEDSGEIKFAAKNVESTAYLEVEALPANIVKPLQDKTAVEKTRVVLDCTVTNPRCSIRWYKGPNVILPSERFEICSEGCYRKLVIQQVQLEDEGTYSVQVGNYTSSAKLTVVAQSILIVNDLKDVEVIAPADACFACEVSLPEAKAPTWTLNGQTLHPGPKVVMEKLGTIHRLTLKQTSEEMSGTLCFIIGQAKSTAHLHVRSSH
ncbi:obscurin isoform X12 [Paramisgurnus dabryanus]|uniref:obscurin isoform X12 n=1 Tax=Paramisgurnus dabryanus TaxID=90735 RepID=UPI0031F3BE3E